MVIDARSHNFCLVVTYVISAHISLAKQIIWPYQLHEMRKYNLTMSPEGGISEISTNHNKTGCRFKWYLRSRINRILL